MSDVIIDTLRGNVTDEGRRVETPEAPSAPTPTDDESARVARLQADLRRVAHRIDRVRAT